MAKNRKYNEMDDTRDVYASELDFNERPRQKRGKKKSQYLCTERVEAWEALEDERQAVAEFFL